MPGQKWEKPTETTSHPVDLLKRLKNWQYKEHMYEGVITRLKKACCKDKSPQTALISHSKVTAVMTPSTPEKWRLIPCKEWKTEPGNFGKWSTTEGRDPILRTEWKFPNVLPTGLLPLRQPDFTLQAEDQKILFWRLNSSRGKVPGYWHWGEQGKGHTRRAYHQKASSLRLPISSLLPHSLQYKQNV